MKKKNQVRLVVDFFGWQYWIKP